MSCHRNRRSIVVNTDSAWWIKRLIECNDMTQRDLWRRELFWICWKWLNILMKPNNIAIFCTKKMLHVDTCIMCIYVWGQLFVSCLVSSVNRIITWHPTDSIWYKQMYQHNMQIMCMHNFLSTKSALKISNRSTLK